MRSLKAVTLQRLSFPIDVACVFFGRFCEGDDWRPQGVGWLLHVVPLTSRSRLPMMVRDWMPMQIFENLLFTQFNNNILVMMLEVDCIFLNSLFNGLNVEFHL
jgi:hypothetical protein